MSCDLACQTKIVVNGGNVAGISRANNLVIERLRPEDFDKLNGDKMIKLLNRMEDDAVEVQKMLVDGAGYTGEVGKMLA